jgi:hypothetical protein
MENKNEIIINTSNTINDTEPTIKVRKPKTEAQREAQKRYYLKIKSNPEYMERSRISSKKHYDSHKEEVLERIKKYQKDKLEFAMMEKLYELHQEQQLDLHTGDITQDEYNKLQEKMTNKLAHLHLVS